MASNADTLNTLKYTESELSQLREFAEKLAVAYISSKFNMSLMCVYPLI